MSNIWNLRLRFVFRKAFLVEEVVFYAFFDARVLPEVVSPRQHVKKSHFVVAHGFFEGILVDEYAKKGAFRKRQG